MHETLGERKATMQKLVVRCIVLVFVALGWRAAAVAAQPLAPRGELRIVDTHPLNWAFIALGKCPTQENPPRTGLHALSTVPKNPLLASHQLMRSRAI